METHTLTIEPGIYFPFEGECSCSNPDWNGEQWSGHVVYYGSTREEVEQLHRDHVSLLG